MHVTALVIITGITAERGQGIGSDGDKTGEGQSAANVFYIGVETAILMDDDDTAELIFCLSRFGQQGLDRAAAFGGVIVDIAGSDAGIIGRDPGGVFVIGHEETHE